MTLESVQPDRARRSTMAVAFALVLLGIALLAPGAYEALRYEIRWAYSTDHRSLEWTRTDRWGDTPPEVEGWFLASGKRASKTIQSDGGLLRRVEWFEDDPVSMVVWNLGARDYVSRNGFARLSSIRPTTEEEVGPSRDAPWSEEGFEAWRSRIGLAPPDVPLHLSEPRSFGFFEDMRRELHERRPRAPASTPD